MKDKEKLKKLINLIGDLLSIQGNEWLIDEIIKTISKTSNVDSLAKHSLIQNIYEFCIEHNIENQANEFYSRFPFDDIKGKLIQDFKKMEHERRRDDFENFCLCLYQQIENITNYLFDLKVEPIWPEERNNNAISMFDKKQNKYVKHPTNGKTITELVFESAGEIEELSKWPAKRKFRAVLYYCYFGGQVLNEYAFNAIFYTQNDIYQMRNENHRGNKPIEYQQNKLNNIRSKSSRYYLKFYGFLEDFVTKIENNVVNENKDTDQKSGQIYKNDNFYNQVLAENPELKKILKELEDQ